MDSADVDVEVDLLAEALVAHVAGEGALLVVHQPLVLVEHGLHGRGGGSEIILSEIKLCNLLIKTIIIVSILNRNQWKI